MNREKLMDAVSAIVTASDRLSFSTDPLILALEDQTEVPPGALTAINEAIAALRAEIDSLEHLLK